MILSFFDEFVFLRIRFIDDIFEIYLEVLDFIAALFHTQRWFVTTQT